MLSDKNVDARGQKRIPEQIEESKRSPLFFYTRMNYDKNVSALRQKRILERNSVRPDLTKSSMSTRVKRLSS